MPRVGKSMDRKRTLRQASATTKTKRPAKKPERTQLHDPDLPITVETYLRPSASDLGATYNHQEPSAINGIVKLRRYRITVEVIDEPIEVLRARLLDLWKRIERNGHYTGPMHRAAIELGIENPREFLKYEEQGILYDPKSWR